MATTPADEENVWEVFNNNIVASLDVTPAGLRRKIRDLKRELPEEDPLILMVRCDLACRLRDIQEFMASEEEFKALLAINQRLNGYFHEDTIEVVKELAFLLVHSDYRRDGQWDEVDALVRGYRFDLDKADATCWPDAKVDLEAIMGHVLVKTSMFNEKLRIPGMIAGIPLLTEAIPILEVALKGLQHRWHLGKDTLRVMSNLAIAYSRLGRTEDALDIQEDVLRKTREKWMDRTLPAVTSELLNCGGFAASARQYERSEALFRECLSRLELDKTANKSSDRDLGSTVMSLGQLLEHLDRTDEARDLGLQYLDRLKQGKYIALGCVPSFQPKKAYWLPK
ncbi:hypothetical protein MMC17_000617 [Xylographa soralifera]|nr:hypothetical protein [Xylographa soralifera]